MPAFRSTVVAYGLLQRLFYHCLVNPKNFLDEVTVFILLYGRLVYGLLNRYIYLPAHPIPLGFICCKYIGCNWGKPMMVVK